KALTDDALYRVRGVPGVAWAVPLFKGTPRAKAFDGNFRVVIMMGVDDSTLVGAPRNMVLGSADGLRRPDAVIIDRVGYEFFFPGQAYELGKTLELNDHRATICRHLQFVSAVSEPAGLLFALQPGDHIRRPRTKPVVVRAGKGSPRN